MTGGRGGGPPLRGLLVFVAMLCVGWAGALAYLKLTGALDPTPAVAAPGLRARPLPAGLAGVPAPRQRLRAARGGDVDSAALAGRPYAVTFLYTRCPDVCPLIGQEVRMALERLGPRAAGVEVLGVSVDPRGDTVASARAWLRRQRSPANFRYLIGSEAELRPVWQAYFAAPQTVGEPETSTHTASLWLVDAHGRLRAKYSAGAPVPPEDLAHDLDVLLDEANEGASGR